MKQQITHTNGNRQFFVFDERDSRGNRKVKDIYFNSIFFLPDVVLDSFTKVEQSAL